MSYGPLVVGSREATFIDAPGGEQIRVTNIAGETVYYKDSSTVSSSSSDGSLTAGQSVLLTAGRWFIANQPTGVPANTRLMLSAVDEERAREPLFNILDYGAVAGASVSNATRNTTALGYALAAVESAGRGTLVFPPSAVFVFEALTRTIDNLTVDGLGATLRTTRTLADQVNALWLKGDNITVRNLRFEDTNFVTTAAKNAANPSNGDLLRVGGVGSGSIKENVTVENCVFYGGFTAGLTAHRAANVTLRGNRVERTNGNGIGVVNCTKWVVVDGNTVYNTGDDLIIVNTDVASVAGGTVRAIVTGNIVDTGDAKGIAFAGVDYGVIANNHVRNTFTFGISAFEDTVFGTPDSDHVIISGNTVERAGYCYGGARYSATVSTVPYGIYVSDTADVVRVVDNVVIDTVGRGISVGTANDLDVSGNLVKTAGDAGIQIGDPADTSFTKVTDCTVRGNTIRSTANGLVIGSVTGLTVSGNTIRSYKNAATGSRRGILYGYLKNAVISDNVIVNDDAGDETILEFPVSSVHTRLHGNTELSSTSVVELGNVFTVGTQKMKWAAAAPVAGAWLQGDIVWNTGVAAAGSPGWICTTAGTPGTWKAMAAVAA